MAYHDDLLRLARDLANKPDPTQAEFRRSVSTAYYALFHLLVGETTLKLLACDGVWLAGAFA
jgi:hypothetical protein